MILPGWVAPVALVAALSSSGYLGWSFRGAVDEAEYLRKQQDTENNEADAGVTYEQKREQIEATSEAVRAAMRDWSRKNPMPAGCVFDDAGMQLIRRAVRPAGELDAAVPAAAPADEQPVHRRPRLHRPTR